MARPCDVLHDQGLILCKKQDFSFTTVVQMDLGPVQSTIRFVLGTVRGVEEASA